MQIIGGAAYLRGNRVERIYREVKVNAIGGGSEEIMRDLAVRQMGL
jgi:acyl-CoA dehydrogenase